LAGDELEDGGDAGVVATGFYRLGVWDDEPDDKRAAEFEGLDDMLRATGEAFLGSTLGCARCHDHMFDPVSQKEYYELLAFFSNVRGYGRPKEEDGNAVLRKTGDGWALAMSEHGGEPRKTHVLARGDAGTPEGEVGVGFPQVFGGGEPVVVAREGTTGRRLALAEWIADAANPLTARVMVNRVWKHHFGRGLVETPNDFGGAGVAPSNPELLDWLAAEFVGLGWSVKALHRVILRSATYRRSSAGGDVGNQVADPGNRYLWRQSLRRLEAEAVRDSMLAVAGNLNREVGGVGFFPLLGGQVIAGGSRPGRGWGYSERRDRERRSVYAFVKRTMMVPMLEVFDYANTEGPVGARPVTTVAPQALTLLNSEFVVEQARVAAETVFAKIGEGAGLKKQVRGVFRQLMAREPTEEEEVMGVRFLRGQLESQRGLLSRMVFRPEVPERLADGLRNALPPERMLVGPEVGWEYGKGVWGEGYEGTAKADAERGAFALWEGSGLVEGFRGRLGIDGATERVGVLYGVKREGEELSGFELVVRPKAWRWELRRLGVGVEPALVAAGELLVDVGSVGIPVRMDAGGVWLGEERVGEGLTGRIGVRAWKGAATLEKVEVVVAGEVVAVPSGWAGGDRAEIGRRGLAEFCSLVFNLNEFLYVD
ncbi:MAG: DUF1553 domain-containing protein, partial [Verrucomicrobiales bacterium]|nr:DUF1553 domain-containing protein [Verrucomicrobiales bacterium]